METIILDKDIKVFYVQAESFPDGIEAAHKKLHDLAPVPEDRKCFGVSRPENHKIVYKAALEQLKEGEAENMNCNTMIIHKGNYCCITVEDFRNNIIDIGKSFEILCSLPDIDPDGYCVEWYFNDKDVRCMIRISD